MAHAPYGRTLLGCLVAAILILSLAAVIEQQQTNNLSRENDNFITSLQSALDSESAQIRSLNSTVVQIQSVTTTVTVTNITESAYGSGPVLVPASVWLTAPGGTNIGHSRGFSLGQQQLSDHRHNGDISDDTWLGIQGLGW